MNVQEEHVVEDSAVDSDKTCASVDLWVDFVWKVALAQVNGTISVGSFLTAADKATSWYSHSADFAFGFKKLQNQFLLSIWYNKIPEETWFANDGKTVSAGSKVQLTADRGLVLSDSQGKELWKSAMLSGTASNGVFNDTLRWYSCPEQFYTSMVLLSSITTRRISLDRLIGLL
ncbi:G-type lectin S-receptor-like serine/threonine protein kinase RLK1-like [Heracleum sosnowskyi]|uniref:G-type lectin S-receptor-like serine/threonine protein kinase RLK1-like n=1 Tax=Heracleum sosnowskyi TaxID=360622 RepID=A0AAD8IRI2_9APIA|nr:G-type lectin S-receptor-like serine/threonine protein kinase RLK1-like [Heracleum sosnowskyi]